jgi:hypothetical protein
MTDHFAPNSAKLLGKQLNFFFRPLAIAEIWGKLIFESLNGHHAIVHLLEVRISDGVGL